MRSVITTALFLTLCVAAAGVVRAEVGATTEVELVADETIYTCPMHPAVHRMEPGLCPLCGMSLVPEPVRKGHRVETPVEPVTEPPKKVEKTDERPTPEVTVSPDTAEAETIYICPMHPQMKQTKPGSCPICGMDLQPLSEKEAMPTSRVPGFASVKINPRQQWLIGVKIADVVRKNLVRHLRTVGTVAYDPKLYLAQKEYLAALKTGRAASSKSLIKAARRKLLSLGMSETEIVQLEKEGNIDESLFLTEGTGKAWIYSTIYESERALLREGLNVAVQTVGHPQMQYSGQVDAITPVVNPHNRTITVRSVIEDPLGMLQSDMFVDVYMEIPLGEALTVPKSAVLQTGLRNIVMVAKGDGIFEPREVVLGNQTHAETQVISGLNEGERVVSSANFLIDSESQIRGAFEAVGTPGDREGHQHAH